MLPARPSVVSRRWGDLWFVARPGSSGEAQLYETVGPAVLVQTQMMARDGVRPNDVTYDGTRISTRPIAIDGVWGQETMRWLWAYANRLQDTAQISREELNAIAGYGRTRSPSYLQRVLKTALRLLYFSPRIVRTSTSEQVVPVDPAQVVTDANLFLAPIDVLTLERSLPRLPEGAYRARPTQARFDGSVPATGIGSIDSLRSPGGAQSRPGGPWTIPAGQEPPVVIGGVSMPSQPTFEPGRQEPTPTSTPTQATEPAPTTTVKDRLTPSTPSIPAPSVPVRAPAPQPPAAPRSLTGRIADMAASVARSPYFVPALSVAGLAAGVGLVYAGFEMQRGRQKAAAAANKAMREAPTVKLPPNVRFTVR